MIERSNYRAQARASARARAGGFTLLEVMVAVVITAIGLLGIAKIQALAYASTGTASVRSLVAIEAAGLAASMHADRAYWSAGGAPSPLTITGGTGTGYTISDNTLQNMGSAANYCQSGGAGAPCSPTAMASYDLNTWARALMGPGGLLADLNSVTTITCQAAVPVTCTIQITWNERAVSINSQGVSNTQVDTTATANSTGTFAPTYMLYVEP